MSFPSFQTFARGARILCLPAATLFVVMLSALAARAAEHPDYVAGKSAWQRRDYEPAVQRLIVYRGTPYGRSAEVDYMIGTAGCRLEGWRVWGSRVLSWLLRNYSLDPSSRTLVKSEYDLCAGTDRLPALDQQRVAVMLRIGSAGSSGSGKMFGGFGADAAVTNRPARQLRVIPANELAARRVALGDMATAKRTAASLAKAPKAVACSRVVIATTSGQSEAELQGLCATFEKYLAFLQRAYAVELPSSVITVYLVPSTGELRALSRSIHGLDLNPQTIGYAFYDDLSILAIVRGSAAGTVLHELFHLTVHNNFGDIPQWLDEGVAALYEVSSPCGDNFYGSDNWRGRVLQRFGVPALERVITGAYFPFDVPEYARAQDIDYGPLADFAQDTAAARYFALYLQEKGLLTRAYAAFRDRDPGQVQNAEKDAIATVENVLQRPIAEVQSDFERWFRNDAKHITYDAGRCNAAPQVPPGTRPAGALSLPAVAAGPVAEPAPAPASRSTAASPAASSPAAAPAPPAVTPSRGCGCRLSDRSHSAPWGGLLVGIALMAAFIRRH